MEFGMQCCFNKTKQKSIKKQGSTSTSCLPAKIWLKILIRATLNIRAKGGRVTPDPFLF